MPDPLLAREEAWGLAHASVRGATVDGEMVDEEADWRPAELLGGVRKANAREELRAGKAIGCSRAQLCAMTVCSAWSRD